MEKLKKCFGDFNLTWLKLIIFAILAGVYTAIMAIIPVLKDTSFADITISFEVWILFGVFIIMNSKSPLDSALKCFVFFLISQPIVYLIQVPFNTLKWGIFVYYKTWFIWTLLTFPMGYFGYYIKKDKWWGLFILTSVLLFLGMYHYSKFLREAISFIPHHHLLSAIFCIITMVLYPIVMFNDKKLQKIGVVISIIIIIVSTAIVFKLGKSSYNTSLFSSDGDMGIPFDDTYKVYFEETGNEAHIEYYENLDCYMVDVRLRRLGMQHLVLESPDGVKTIFEVDVKRDTYKVSKK